MAQNFVGQEGNSVQRPPLLLGGENYNDWKFRMRTYLERDGYEWDAVENGIKVPVDDLGKKKSYKSLSQEEKDAFNYNARDMNSLINGMVTTELNKVSACSTAKKMWDILKVSHEGTFKVREHKISMLMHDYENFKIEKDENVKDAQSRFLTLTNDLALLKKKIPQVEINQKVLRVMPKRIDSNRTLLYDSPNLSTMDTLTLFCELGEYESQLKR